MRVLQMFFRYGLKVSQGEAASSSSNRWEEEKDMNLPLNHHWKEGFEFSINDGSVCMPDSANLFSFDTYESASDAPVEDAFRDKSSELRMYSISAIQVKLQIPLGCSSRFNTNMVPSVLKGLWLSVFCR